MPSSLGVVGRWVSGALNLSCVVTTSCPTRRRPALPLSPSLATENDLASGRGVAIMSTQYRTPFMHCAPCGLAQRGAASLDSLPSPGAGMQGVKPSLHPCLEGHGLHQHQGPGFTLSIPARVLAYGCGPRQPGFRPLTLIPALPLPMATDRSNQVRRPVTK